jgi:mycofactocin system glycosyltransferase
VSPRQLRLTIDPSVRRFGTTLLGGQPTRLMKLSPAGLSVLDDLQRGCPPTPGATALFHRLVTAGLAHPRGEGTGTLTVVIPVHNRPDELEACLDALGTRWPVVVVDDASEHPPERRPGVRHLRLDVNSGPGAARNAGAALCGTEFIAFVDSDVTISGDDLAGLLSCMDDPEVVATAPRIRPLATGRTNWLSRFADGHSDLDLGALESEVGPGKRVTYVPSAVLVIRRDALDDGFDEDLRVGEDVDLVWRLVAAGGRIRYNPGVVARHREPTSWARWFRRRYSYGTSAGPLAVRHPSGPLRPTFSRWPTLSVIGLLSARRSTTLVGAAAAGWTVTRATRTLRLKGIPGPDAARMGVAGMGWTLVGLLSWALTAFVPLALLRRKRRWLVVLPALVAWWNRKPELDPVRWVAASLVDDVAYGAGVWAGCLKARTLAPLLPRWTN